MHTFTHNDTKDHADRFASAFAEAAASGRTGVVVPPGVYPVSRTVEVPVGMSLHLEAGACIQAMPDFQGEAVVRKARDVVGVHRWGGRISGGMIDGGRQNVIGIHVLGACRLDIAEIEIIDCLMKGIYIGQPLSDKTWGYEVNISHVRCAIDLETRHAEGSVGIHYEQITDSFIAQAVIIGYETGVA